MTFYAHFVPHEKILFCLEISSSSSYLLLKLDDLFCKNLKTLTLLLPQHTSREFYNNEGDTVLRDSGVWTTPLDYLGIKPFSDVPMFKNASLAPQYGVYGGFPYYLPLRQLMRYVLCDSDILPTNGHCNVCKNFTY